MEDPMKVGQVNGHDIVVVPSKGNAFSALPEEERARCAHLIANPAEMMTRAEAYAARIRPGAIADLLRTNAGEIRPDLLAHFGLENDCGARIEVNDLITATMNTVHVHVLVAPAEFWKSGKFRRCVDSILAPVKQPAP
jgi:hypothetical protein